MGEGLKPLPITWPSILRELFWRIKTAGLGTSLVSIHLASIPDFWASPCPPQLDRRFRILNKFMLPSAMTLAVTNRALPTAVSLNVRLIIMNTRINVKFNLLNLF